jgi:hypothetical protein
MKNPWNPLIVVTMALIVLSCGKDENVEPGAVESYIQINGDYQSLAFSAFPLAWRSCKYSEQSSSGTPFNVFGMAIDPANDIGNITVGGLVINDYFGIIFMEIIPTDGEYQIVDPNSYASILDIPDGRAIIQINEGEFYAQSGKVIVSTDGDLSARFNNVTFTKWFDNNNINENVDSFVANGAIRCDN